MAVDLRTYWRRGETPPASGDGQSGEPEPPAEEPDPIDLVGDYWHVEAGDTLYGDVAAAWGLDVPAVADFNLLGDPDLIKVGDILVRPGTPPPTDAQHKDEIIAWLRVQGIDVKKKAKSRMTKSELLDLVVDYTDSERD